MKTKKNKLTNFLKIGILLFGISLLLFNCEKDNEINEPFDVSVNNNKLNYTLEKISYPELIIDQEIEKSLPIIKGRFFNKKRKTQSKKTTQISEHFSIITDSIHKITTEDAITWTFKIETPVLQNSDFENFLVKKHNEKFSYFLISYQKDLETVYKKATSYPISKEFLNLNNLNLARRGDYLMDDGISNGGGTCEGKIYTEIEPCNQRGVHTAKYCCQHYGGIHGCGNSRPCDYTCTGTNVVTIIDFSHCYDGSDLGLNDIPDYNTSDNNTQNGDSGLSNNAGSSSSGGTTITNPVTLECDNCSESLISKLNLTDQIQIDWVNGSNNSAEVDAIFDFCVTNNWSDEAVKASKITIASLTKNKLLGPYDDNFFNTINEHIDADLTDPYLQAVFMAHFSAQCAVLKFENPDWSSTRIYWEASKEMIHIALDLGGMVPVIGEVCDLTNGIIYTIEGDGVNATLSFAATIPIAGWAATGTKYAIKASTLGTKVRLTWKVLANGTIYFGSSGSKLRKVLGITDATKHAHHLIPWAQRLHPAVQKAAKSGNAFHINEALNGIARPSNLHLIGHSAYNTKILQILNSINPNASIDEAYDFVSGFANHIRTLITNNPTLNSGQIANLISYP